MTNRQIIIKYKLHWYLHLVLLTITVTEPRVTIQYKEFIRYIEDTGLCSIFLIQYAAKRIKFLIKFTYNVSNNLETWSYWYSNINLVELCSHQKSVTYACKDFHFLVLYWSQVYVFFNFLMLFINLYMNANYRTEETKNCLESTKRNVD